MKKNSFLRTIAIILLGLSAAFTLLGGGGSTCIAFRPEQFGAKWAPFIAIKPTFQALVVISLAAALYGIYAIIQLVKSKPGAYARVIIFLVVGGAASAVQYYYSMTLRGSTAPNNIRLYTTLVTLIVMLLLRFLPGAWERTGFSGQAGSAGTRTGTGAALMVCGLLTLTTPWWAASTHMVAGYNTANELLWPLILGGAALLAAGARLTLAGIRSRKASAAQAGLVQA